MWYVHRYTLIIMYTGGVWYVHRYTLIIMYTGRGIICGMYMYIDIH